MCDNLPECTSPAVKIPDGNSSEVDEFVFNTESMLVTLNSTVDYEVEQYYVVIFEIVDEMKSPPLTGQATLKV